MRRLALFLWNKRLHWLIPLALLLCLFLLLVYLARSAGHSRLYPLD